MQTEPLPAHPSYRTLVALRLLCLPNSAYATISEDRESSPWDSNLPADDHPEDSYNRWKACVLGFEDIVSQQNERDARAVLDELCLNLESEAREALLRLEGEFRPETIVRGQSGTRTPAIVSDAEGSDWVPYATSCIQTLWNEQVDVASSVRQSLRDEVVF